MLLFSQIIGRPVVDAKGTTLGRLKDLIAAGGRYPAITALVVEGTDRRRFTVAWEQVASVNGTIHLTVNKKHIVSYEPNVGEFALSEQVLDRQLLDVDDHKVGKVNDIQLGKTNSHYRLLAVDPSTRGLFRRLGLEGAANLASLVGIHPEDYLIPWENLEPLGGRTPGLRITLHRSALPKIHPSDLAEIVEQLSVRESSTLIEAMDDEVAADTLEEVSERRQVQILKEMESERAADILQEMGPNDAADVLADMPAQKAAELLSLMEKKESKEVQELLAYPEESAGGIMTTEYVCLPEGLTVSEAMRKLRKMAQGVDNVYSLYVVDGPGEERLIGSLSLRDLIIAAPKRTLGEIVDRSPVTVNLKDPQEAVAGVVARYNLLSVPVVDDQNRLQGIVTVDDAMDVLLPSNWRRRFPRMFQREVGDSAS